MFALVDCNNFYASCERLFQPKLRNRPLVVLSNNDGCIIARSNEAKALGIKMGAPFFKNEEFLRQNNVAVFSANFSLYGDISERVMTSLEQFAPDIEVYSIDEAFLNLTAFNPAALNTYAKEIRRSIFHWIGIPVCVGIAPTKTLAKLANHIAKKQMQSGVFLIDESKRNEVLSRTKIEDVWGIGSRLTRRLQAHGMTTALQLTHCTEKWILANFNVTLLRTIAELRGTNCLELETVTPPRQTICCSRSFKEKVNSLCSLKEAISTFTAKATEKLRRDELYCPGLSVFIRTSPFAKEQPSYSNSAFTPISPASNDTCALTQAADRALESIYRPDHLYSKAGVILLNLHEGRPFQPELFSNKALPNRTSAMKAIDKINREYGIGTLRLLSQGIGKREWHMQRGRLSPPYTRSWKHLPIVKAN